MKPSVSSRFAEGLFYALTAFGPFAFGCVEPWSRAVLETLIFLLALACFLRGRPAVSAAAAEFWLFPAVFAALGLFQLRTSVVADGPWPHLPFTTAPYATGAAVLLWASYAALLWSVPRVFVTHEAARRYIRFLFGMGLVLTAFGAVQAVTDPDKLYWVRETYRAGFGPYYNRDDAANLLLMCMAAGIGFLFSRLRRGASLDGTPIQHLRTQASIAAGVLFLFSGVVACTSRGALLATLLTGSALMFFGADFARRTRHRRARAAAALASAVFVIFVSFQYVGAGAAAGALVDRSIMGRFSIYGDARRWLKDAPLFGTGLGSFETIYPAYQDLELRATVAHAHSDWLEIALESGMLGLLAALAAAGLAARAALRTWRAARSEEMRALIGGGLAAAAAFSIHALFEFCFQIPGNAVVFLGIVGFLLSAPAWADKAADRARSQPPSAPLALLAVACFLFLAQAAVRPAAAAWLADASGDSGVRAMALARAYSVDPDPSYLVRYASTEYEAGLNGPGGLKAMRAAFTTSMAAVDQRPFDFEALSLAGVSLWVLQRRTDASVLLDEASSVRFSPLVVSGPNEKTGFSRAPVKP